MENLTFLTSLSVILSKVKGGIKQGFDDVKKEMQTGVGIGLHLVGPS